MGKVLRSWLNRPRRMTDGWLDSQVRQRLKMR
jgi:hypothetical protein